MKKDSNIELTRKFVHLRAKSKKIEDEIHRKRIRCDCGNKLTEKTIGIDNIKTKALICPKCSFTTLNKGQAKKYIKSKNA